MALKLVGLSGSLRGASFNTALLGSAKELLSARSAPVELTIYDYRAVPFYDSDLEKPSSVIALEQAIQSADGVLIATPEYNYGIPGVLKNAIDWASRPAYASPFYARPVGVLGASPGAIGTARAQGQLKQVLLGMASQVFPYPEFNLGGAGSRIADGRITDSATLGVLEKYLGAYVDWVEKVKLR